MATGGVHLPRPARLSPPSRDGEGLQRQRGRLLRALPHLAASRAAPPAAAPAPLQPGPGIRGRGRAGNFAAAGGAAPPGASASVRVAGGLLGAAAERGTRGKVSSAPGGRGGGGSSRRRLRRPKLRRGCAQDAFERRGGGTGFGAARPSARPRGSSSLCPRKSGGRGSSISSPGGTPERRSGRLQQGGRVGAPAAGAFRGVRPPSLALPRAPGAGF